jgi:hypothetical protein
VRVDTTQVNWYCTNTNPTSPYHILYSAVKNANVIYACDCTYTCICFPSNDFWLVWIRDRIDPPHPLACRKRWLNGAVLRIETVKAEAPCHSRCDTINIPPCAKVLSAEHRPKLCSPSPVRVTSALVKNSWAGRKTVNNQSNLWYLTISYILHWT